MPAAVHLQQRQILQAVSAKYPCYEIVQTSTGLFSGQEKSQTVSGQFLGTWGQINSPTFNPIEFDGIKKLAGLNSYKEKVSVKVGDDG